MDAVMIILSCEVATTNVWDLVEFACVVWKVCKWSRSLLWDHTRLSGHTFCVRTEAIRRYVSGKIAEVHLFSERLPVDAKPQVD